MRDYYKDRYFYCSMPSIHDFTPSGKVAGAVLAISSIENAVPIIHGSIGCGFHYRYVCRRGWKPAYNLVCSDLKEKDIIMGGSKKLKKAILYTIEKYNPSLIAIISSTSIDMIHDDIQNVIDELQDKVNCKLIAIKSNRISHADKRIIGKKTFCEKKRKCHEEHDIKLKGCGFSDAMETIVDKVMEYKTVEDNLINFCGIHLGIDRNAITDGIIRELDNLGCSVNCLIPNCTMEELINAPKAKLNLITSRVKWVSTMKEKFGTDYFVIDESEYIYKGADGLKEFYMEIVERLNLDENAKSYINMKSLMVKDNINKKLSLIKDGNCIVCMDDYRNLDRIVSFYSSVLKIKIEYLYINTPSDGYMSVFSKEKLYEMAKESIEDISVKLDYEIKWKINFTQRDVSKVINEVNYYIGNDDYLESRYKNKKIYGPSFMPLNFEDYEKAIIEYISNIVTGKSVNKELLLANKLNEEIYNVEGSKKMWDKLWHQRGGKMDELQKRM